MATFRLLLLLVGCFFLLIVPVQAQSEMERERASLQDLDGFYLSVVVEGSSPVLAHDSLDFQHIHQRIRTRLQLNNLPVQAEGGVLPEHRTPYLLVHINTMEADRGQVPFSIQMQFYQAVQLPRTVPISTVASTWETGVVGLAYHNQLSFIPDAAVNLVGEFITDFQRANP